MGDLSSYALSDFLLFTPRIYFRLYELYNSSVWPAHILILGATAISLWLTLRRMPATRFAVPLVLGALWVWVAFAFHQRHYETINWAAEHFTVGFGLQGALLIAAGATGLVRFEVQQTKIRRCIGLAMLLYAIFGLPFVGLLAGRPWQGMEIFGLAPDPTALGTIGFLILANGRLRWALFTLPVAWIAISTLTYLAMDRPHGLATGAVLLIGILAAIAAGWFNASHRR